jgi:hypothetical protein
MKRYFDAFPRSQIKVYLFDEFRKNPGGVMEDLFAFLGVDPTFVPDTTPKYNPASIPKSRVLNRLFYHPAVIRTAKSALPAGVQEFAKRVRQLNLKSPPQLSADLRSQLLNLYRDDIRRLEALLDQDLSIWFDGSRLDHSSRPAKSDLSRTRLTAS